MAEAHLRAEDIESLTARLTHLYAQSSKRQAPCNVLFVGPSGAGKSSLVNAIFPGLSIHADAEAGAPVTKDRTLYEGVESPIRVYDAKGDKFASDEQTRKYYRDQVDFLVSTNRKNAVDDHIHMVWLIVNAGTSRCESYIKSAMNILMEAPKALLPANALAPVVSPLPILLVFNKRELVSPHELRQLVLAAEEMGIPENDIFCVTAEPQKVGLQTMTQCPECGADDVIVRKRTRLHCEMPHCRYNGQDYVLDSSIQPLIDRTIDLLPKQQQLAFAVAQNVSVEGKYRASLRVVKRYSVYAGTGVYGFIFGAGETTETDTSVINEMAAQLSAIWHITGSVESAAPLSVAVSVSVVRMLPSLLTGAVLGGLLPEFIRNKVASYLPANPIDGLTRHKVLVPYVGLTLTRALREAYEASLAAAVAGAELDIQRLTLVSTPDPGSAGLARVRDDFGQMWREFNELSAVDEEVAPATMDEAAPGQTPAEEEVKGAEAVLRRRKANEDHDMLDDAPAEEVFYIPHHRTRPSFRDVLLALLPLVAFGGWVYWMGSTVAMIVSFPLLFIAIINVIRNVVSPRPSSIVHVHADSSDSGAPRAPFDALFDQIMQSAGVSVDNSVLRNSLKSALQNTIKNATAQGRLSLQDRIERNLRADGIPEFVIRAVTHAIDRILEDVNLEIMRAATATLRGRRRIMRKSTHLSFDRGLRSFVLYTLFPCDRTFWDLTEDPMWWMLTVLFNFPLWGIRELCWSLIYIWVDRTDLYQVADFVVRFKSLQFLTLGLLPCVIGAAKYFWCSNAVEATCSTNGPRLEWVEAAFFVIQLACMLHAYRLIGRIWHREPTAVDPNMPSGAPLPVSEPLLRRMIRFDLIAATLLVTMCIASFFTGERKTHGYSEVAWQLKAIFYWSKVIYGLLSLQFLVFKLPFMMGILTHATKTGYDQSGNTVEFQPPSRTEESSTE